MIRSSDYFMNAVERLKDFHFKKTTLANIVIKLLAQRTKKKKCSKQPLNYSKVTVTDNG